MNADKGLVIEQSLMLYYPAPIYFFVNSVDTELADRIARGLTIAINDGSFNELFLSTPGFKKGYEEIAGKRRRIFELEQTHELSASDKLPL